MNDGLKPDLDAFASMAVAARRALPEPFRSLSADVLVRVADFADEGTLGSLGIEDPMELLGLYEGIDLTAKSLFDTHDQPDMVWLYRRPILRTWMEGPDDLQHVIDHVLIHEIGHHFGLSDDDMYGLEDEAYDEEGVDEGDRPARG